MTPPPVPAATPSAKAPLFLVLATALLWPIDTLLALISGMNDGMTPPELVGASLVPLLVVLVVWGIARILKQGKTAKSFFTIAFWTLGVLFFANLLNFANAAVGTRTVTDAERAGLEVGTDSIRHPGFGFVLPSPGPGFVADSELQQLIDQEYAGQRGIVAWGCATSSGRRSS